MSTLISMLFGEEFLRWVSVTGQSTVTHRYGMVSCSKVCANMRVGIRLYVLLRTCSDSTYCKRRRDILLAYQNNRKISLVRKGFFPGTVIYTFAGYLPCFLFLILLQPKTNNRQGKYYLFSVLTIVDFSHWFQQVGLPVKINQKICRVATPAVGLNLLLMI